MRDELNLENDIYEKNNVPIIKNNIFWTKFLRIISIINLVCGIIIGLYLWYYIADNFYRNEELIGFCVCFITILLTMISTSGIMVFVEMSENVSKLLEISQNKK